MDWTGCEAVEVRADKMSGLPVFAKTRIPVATFFENLKAGATLDEFLEWFPGSRREQLEAVFDFIADKNTDRESLARPTALGTSST